MDDRIAVKLSDEDYTSFCKIAKGLGFIHPSLLLDAIAEGKVDLERVAQDPEREGISERAKKNPRPRPKRKEKQLPHVPERWSPRCGYTHARWLRLRRKIDGSA